MPKKINSPRKKLTRQELRDLDLEILFLEGSFRRDPAYIEALQILGDDYTRRGRFAEGLKIDERLSRLRPDDAVVHYNLACSYSLTEQIEAGLRGPGCRHQPRLPRFQSPWTRPRPQKFAPTRRLQENPRQNARTPAQDALKRHSRRPSRRSMNVTVNHRTRHYRTVTFDARRNEVLLIDQRCCRINSKSPPKPDYRATAQGHPGHGRARRRGHRRHRRLRIGPGRAAFRGRDLSKFARHIEPPFKPSNPPAPPPSIPSTP
jgi:tetratricopeptide (TPR) repeat protein